MVNGHETHVVEMTPPENATAELSLDLQVGDAERRIPLYRAGDTSWVLAGETWWIDTETTYPVKQQLAWEDDDGTTVARATRVYEDLETGVTRGNDTFSFDPPADAEVETSSGRDYEHFTDRDAAAAAVPFALPEPELSGFELRAVIVEDRENSTYTSLSYHNGTMSLVVGVIDTDDDREANSSEVSVLRRDVGRMNETLYLVDKTVWLD